MEWEHIEIDLLVLTENNVMDNNVYKQDNNQADNLQDQIQKTNTNREKKIEQRKLIEESDIQLSKELFSNDNKELKNTETHIVEIYEMRNIVLDDNTRSIKMEKRKKRIEELNKKREQLVAHKTRVKDICDEELEDEYDCIKLFKMGIKHGNSFI